MNEIVSINDTNKLEGYKLIYPTNNKNLSINILDNFKNCCFNTGFENTITLRDLSLFEVLFYCNKMFLNEGNKVVLESLAKHGNPYPVLTFYSKDDKKIIKDFKVKSIKITDSNGDKVKFSYSYVELIKEIYFNKDLEAVLIVIDENFCTHRKKKYLKKKKSKDKKKQKKEQKEKSLLNSIEELLN